MLKKFLVVLSVLICIFGLSVSSMAFVAWAPSRFGNVFVEKDDHYALSFEIKASEFNTDASAFWKRWTDAFTANDSTEIALAFVTSSSQNVQFLLLDSGYTFSHNSSSGMYFLEPSSTSSSFSYISVSCATGLSSSISKVTHSNPYAVNGSYFCFAGYSNLSGLPDSFRYVDFGGKSIEITDDLGSFDVDPPEEPEPPSSSTPGWVPPVVSDPVIPEGDEYVFYDTKILGLFLNHIRSQIVHAANVGWLIFGFILVWHVIKRVIKAFSSR